MLNGDFTVAGGDHRFRIISGGARGQGLRLRQMGDADGVFPGDGVTRGGGTERGGAAGGAVESAEMLTKLGYITKK